jgi:hypothetical protein
LTGWDIDILTPTEFAKGLEILGETLRPIAGVTDELLDKIGALGMISVFDIEELGPPMLVEELGLTDELSDEICTAASARARIVEEERAVEAAKAAERAAEEAAATNAILGGEPIAGAVATDADAESAADSILGFGRSARVND